MHSAIGSEMLDALLVAAAFDTPVSVLFLGPAVSALRNGQSPGPYAEKSLNRQLAVLAEYGIDQIYLCQDALQRLKLDQADLIMPATPLEQREQALLFRAHEVVIYG